MFPLFRESLANTLDNRIAFLLKCNQIILKGQSYIIISWLETFSFEGKMEYAQNNDCEQNKTGIKKNSTINLSLLTSVSSLAQAGYHTLSDKSGNPVLHNFIVVTLAKLF